MIVSFIFTFVWISAIYILERNTLKKSNKTTQWAAICLLIGSGVLWQVLTITGQMSRPAEWIGIMLGFLVPVP